jgi:glutamate--cysteine ligase regulatory subunit
MTGGQTIIRNSTIDKSNEEFTKSLVANITAAQQDLSAIPKLNGNGAVNGIMNGKPKYPPLSAWTTRTESTIFVPAIDWSTSGLSEEQSQYEVTVKLFFLPNIPPALRREHSKEAIGLVLKELGVTTIDLLIVSFPGLSFDGDCEEEANRRNANQGSDDDEAETWHAIEDLVAEGTIKRLGLAEFGSEKLRRFLPRTKVRPSVDQINVRDCCVVPKPLLLLAKQEGIDLLTHNDCSDILPSGTLSEILGQGERGVGVLADGNNANAWLKGNVEPQWVVKYTAVVKDRGVIENKGYFAMAELDES